MRTEDISDDCPPDGEAQAWFVVLGFFMAKIAVTGFSNSWGIFQAYYEQTLLSSLSPATMYSAYCRSWIGSIQRNLSLILGSFAGWLFFLGYFRSMFYSSSIMLILSPLLTAQCRAYWQFLLCHGFLSGSAQSVIISAIYPIISQWFAHRRELANGLMINGSATGGIIFPIICRALIPQIGFQWTMRVLALIMFILLFASALLARERRARHGTTSQSKKIDLTAFRNPCYATYSLAAVFLALGITNLATYIATSAESIGITQAQAFYLVAVINAGLIVGNTSLGPLSDSIGALNVIVFMTPLTAVGNIAWPFARTSTSLFIVAAFYGFTSAGSLNMLARSVMKMGPGEQIASLVGNLNTVFGLVALASPALAGIVLDKYGLEAMGIYSGSVLLVAAALMMVSRQLFIAKRWYSFWVEV
ncbi:hypothetical protein GYMLUDRAFT_151782 [Collybiopsis luxurians FD-317 M1]|nr:hypothetical protein GYMLUDRAFT_151782 [Collybiopsis luxurians FD-317 M1]